MRMVNKNRHLRKSKNSFSIIVLAAIISVIMVTGITFALLYFQSGEKKDVNMGSVKLNTSINYVSNLNDVVGGDTIITSSSFSKASISVPCYVRVKFEFGSDSLSLTREQKNYILALNASDYTSYISTGVLGANWLDFGDNHYYLVNDSGDLLIVNNTTVYSFANDLKLPMLLDVIGEGLKVDSNIDDLYLDVKFQSIQSENLPSTELSDVKDLFDIVFRTQAQEEYLVRFVDVDGNVIEPQVIKNGEQIIIPEKVNYNTGLYIDEQMNEMFNAQASINKSYTIYVKYESNYVATEEGFIFIDNAVVGYVGNEQNITIPQSYTIGEKKLIEKTFNDSSMIMSECLKLITISESGYDIFPVTITVMGESEIAEDADVLSELMLFLMFVDGPYDISYYIDEYEVGGETQVTSIADNALMDSSYYFSQMMQVNMGFAMNKQSSVKNIVIPNTITSIGIGALAFNHLNQLIIPDSVTSIGEGALSGVNINNLVLPSSIESSDNIFLLEGVEDPYYIFELYNQSSLEVDALNVLPNLEASTIYVYKNGDTSLYFDYKNTNFTLIGSCSNKEVLSLPQNGVELVNLYNGSIARLTNYAIGDYAFYGNGYVKHVIIGNNVTSIGEYAFAYCPNLEVLIINNDNIEIIDTAIIFDDNINILVNNNSLIDSFSVGVGYNYAIFIKQADGFEDVEFTLSTNGLYYTGSDGGYNWIKVDVSGVSTYYKNVDGESAVEIPNQITNLTIEGNMVTGFTGSQVVIPSGYDIVEGGFLKSTLLEFISTSHTEGDLFIVDTGDKSYTCTSVSSVEMLYQVYAYMFGVPEDEILNWSVYYYSNEEIMIEGDKYPITKIKEGLFRNNYSIKSVTLPDTITTIPDEMFWWCGNLTTVNLSDNVTSIGKDAFFNCGNLTEINLPSELISIGEEAFQNCSKLTTINFNDKLTSIGRYAFWLCTSLVSITLPNSLTTIGECAFYDCSNLVTVNWPNNLKKISNSAFRGCTKLVSSPPDTVEIIGVTAFSNCTSLAMTALPENIKLVGYNAFYNLSAILSDGDISYLPINNTNNIAILSVNSTSLTTFEWPSNVTVIGGKTFYNCKNLALTSLPNGIVGIGNEAFYSCSNLALTSLPSGLTHIGDHAFYFCGNLALTSLPAGLEYIDSYAFFNCDNVTLTSLPSGLKYIGTRALDGPVVTITSLPESLQAIGGGALVSIDMQLPDMVRETFYVKDNCIISNDKVLIQGFDTSVIPNDIIGIGDYAFYGRKNIALTSLPSGITSIGDFAFSGCSKLVLASLPSGLTNIGEGAFYACGSLALTSLPDGVTIIRPHTFNFCVNLALTSLPDGVTRIERVAFQSCSNLALTSLPAGLTYIENNAFSGCANLALTSLPAGLKYIYEYTFQGCTNLALTSLPSEITGIGEGAFYGCSKIALTSLPDGLKSIYENAFKGCSNLALITLEDGITSVGNSAFQECSNLKYILCASGNVATLVSGKGRDDTYIYSLQATGYSGLTETAVEIATGLTIYTAVDANGYKWVRTSDNKYYKCIVSTVS